MKEPIETLLNSHGTTISKISKQSGISKSTLSATFNRPIKKWSVGTLIAVSKAIHSNLNSLVQDLLPKKWSLDIDNDKQTIQDYHIEDPADFQEDKFVITNECYEGWKPDYDDIKNYVHSYKHPDLKTKVIVKRCVQALKHDE